MSEEKATGFGIKVINALYSLSSILKLYEINNDAVVRIIQSLNDELMAGFEVGLNELHLTLREDEFFINDQLLKVDLALYTKSKEIATILNSFDWGDIRFLSGLDTKEIGQFVQFFSDSLRNSKSMFPAEGFPHIQGKKAQGSSAAAFRFEPERLAIWLYTGLLDIVEQIYVLFKEGQQPSLLPLRRSFQMIIDNMKAHAGIYQMLSAVRPTDSARNTSNQRVAIAIDTVGFGLFLNLPASDLMTLGLSGILGGLTNERSPIESVRPLLKYTGLGELALQLILTLHDARASLGTSQTGVLGQLLMIVEKYHQTLDLEPKTPESEIIRRLVTGDSEQVDVNIAKTFARYKGPYPIGSMVTLNHTTYIVIEHTNNAEGKLKPVVARLKNGELFEKRDLRSDPTRIVVSEREDIYQNSSW